jgi:hypothetical protein
VSTATGVAVTEPDVDGERRAAELDADAEELPMRWT